MPTKNVPHLHDDENPLGEAIWALQNFILLIQLANLTRKRRIFIIVYSCLSQLRSTT